MKVKHAYSIFHQGKVIETSLAMKLLIENQALVAFHGFGQHAGVYKKISTYYPTHVIFSFDLFYHGKSKAVPELYNKDVFVEELRVFFEEYRINKFSLLAFSIGARPALALAAYFPKKLTSLQLIAPDAIYENTWYVLGTRNRWGNWLFRQLKNNEATLLHFIERLIVFTKGKNKLFKLAEKVLIDHSIAKVYNTWMIYSSFSFDSRSVIEVLLEKGVFVQIVLSTKDQVINEHKVKKVLEGLEKNIVTVSYKHEKLLTKLMKNQYFECALQLT